MKNLYVISTDKPSRLYEDVDGDLQLGYDFIVRQGMLQNQNIYITSDEEIKEGDWCLDETFKPVNLWFYPEKLKGKIILTTDQSLDGVQAIDDEFLEWFVKNPSCEWVEVQDWYSKFLSCCRSKEECHCNKKRIIIPKEKPTISDEAKQRAANYMSLKGALEPKQIKCYCGHTTYCDCSPLEEPKQETLEEAAENRFGTDMDSIRGSNVYDLNADLKKGFIAGAKLMQERMYSEEEVKELLETQRGNCYVAILTKTKDIKLASLAMSAPEPSGKNGWVKQFKK